MRTAFTLAAALTLAGALTPDQLRAADRILTTLYSFCSRAKCADGAQPVAALLADANGNLFGTTSYGGASDVGTVFEIAKTPSGYVSAPAILVSFDGDDGAYPGAGLIADAKGSLFGTTIAGGMKGGYGTVFEIAKTAGGYSGIPITLVSFHGADGWAPEAALLADANGNLFGTTYLGGFGFTLSASNPVYSTVFEGAKIRTAKAGGFGFHPFASDSGSGTVFEIVKTAGGYSPAPAPVVRFNGADGGGPLAGLIADADGNLFGATSYGGPSHGGTVFADGTVFAIAKTAHGYAASPTTLVSFTSSQYPLTGPVAGLITDAGGNLFGTTDEVGAHEAGTVFEIAKTARGYASTPTTLVSFNGADGSGPQAGLIADAIGNLFGTTIAGGASGYGTVFEVARTASGHASAPTTLVSFKGANGVYPRAALIADASGHLFGTTEYGGVGPNCPLSIGCGTVFEVAGSGFIPPGDLAGTPGDANCIGKTVAGLAHKYGGFSHAGAALGYSVPELHNEIVIYCGE